jgi:glutamate-1-semialdehyde aminotransferase
MGISQDLYKKAKRLIPGGTQLLSKRPEMFLPDFWPAYYAKAKGCKIWDLDGKKYVDMSYMGVGACTLGYADTEVDKAVKKAIDKGSMTTLNSPDEVELANVLIKLHPWAQMVRYGRTGGEAMAIAVRIARAKSRKDKVLFCGYHGWHDWYLSANLASDKALDGHLLPGLLPLGVPRSLKGTSFPFVYNNTESFLKLIKAHKKEIGAIVLESVRNAYPQKKFLQAVRNAADDLKVPLIVDEITAGFRLNLGGAHLLFKLKPDIAVFAKGMSNGFPMAAIIGTKEVMEAAQDSFISSTYWTDRIGPAAALATIEKMRNNDVARRLVHSGKEIKNGWQKLAEKHGMRIEIGGMDPIGHFSFKHEKPLVLKTLFTQKMLEKGFLATTAFYASFAHTDKDISSYLEAADSAFGFIARAAQGSNPEKYLNGPVCASGFKRLT